MNVLHACMYTACMRDAHRGHNRVPDSLELELRMNVNCYVFAGIRTWILCKSNHYSYPLNRLSILPLLPYSFYVGVELCGLCFSGWLVCF